MFAQAIEDILKDHCAPQAVRHVENGGAPEPLWSALAQAGFLDLLAPESQGGAQLPLAQLHPILALLGRFAMPLPVAQSICARALTGAGDQLPSTPITLAPALVRGADGSVKCPRVPFGALASHVIAADGDSLLLMPTEGAAIASCGDGHAHFATLRWRDAKSAAKIGGNARSLHAMNAGLHASVMSGAMERAFEMTLEHCNDRQQFGRPLGKFQAVQHQLAEMAEHAVAVSMAAQWAFDTDARAPDLLRAAMAKSRASRAVPLIASTAHALHGAIGVTQEFDLQLYTRLLHAWRIACGSETYWDGLVGREVMASDRTLAEFVRTAGAVA